MEEEKNKKEEQHKKAWHEEIEVAGNDLISRVKELIKEGNVRRLIVKNDKGEVMLEIPLTAGVVVGGVLTLAAAPLVALGAVAGLLAKIKLEVVRNNDLEKRD